MTTGNTHTIGGQPRIRRSLALLCAAALLLGLWMPWAKAAVEVVVTAITDTGYSLVTTTGVLPGVAPSTIVFTVTMEAGYSQSALTVTPPDVPVCTLSAPAVTDGVSGEKIYTYELTSATGFSTDVAVTVAGVTTNPPLPPPPIKLTFPANDVYTIFHGDQGGTDHQNPSGADFNFDLRLDSVKYAIPAGMTSAKLNTIVTNCIITAPSATIAGADLNLTISPDPTTEPIIGGGIHGTIPGANLTENTEVSFTIDTTALLPMVTVTDTNPGAGYRLVVEGSVLHSAIEGKINVAVIVDAAYSNSTPVFTAAGYDIGSEPDRPIAGGAKQWNFYIFVQPDGTLPADIPVTVSGVVPNNPPPSGGGDSGGGGGGDSSPATPPTPTIRVENELNPEKSSSDTMLWPGKTVEADGVSTTTVTDAELAALLELARAHKADADSLEGDGLKEGILVVENLKPTSDNQSYVLELTGKQFETLTTEGWDRLTVQTPAGSFSLYPEALTQAGTEITEGSQPVRITLHQLDYENRPGVDASLTVDKNQVTSFETPYGVRIVVPYTPAPGEDLNALAIDYIHEDGTVERVTESHYDAEAGGIVFFTTHLSKFGVTYRPAAFADVTAKHWANPYVTFLTARGVIRGNPGGSYRPDDPITRGEFLSLLTRGLSAAKLPSKPVQIFADVPSKSFVAGASNWLFFNNLAAPLIQNNRLQPQTAITREDMASLVGSVSAGVGLRLRSKGLDTGYTDLKQIADYAQPSVTKLRAAGILEMAKNFKFNPKTTLNRGEAAQIVATLLSNL